MSCTDEVCFLMQIDKHNIIVGLHILSPMEYILLKSLLIISVM